MEASQITQQLTELSQKRFNRVPAEKTLANNTKMILKLQSMVGPSEDWYYQLAKIKDILESNQYAVSTRRNYLSLCLQCILYDQLILNKPVESIAGEFIEEVKALEQTKRTNQKNNIISEKKQEQKQFTFTDLNELNVKLRADGLHRDALMIMILMVYPIRAEVGTLQLISKYKYDKIKGTMPIANYIVKNKSSLVLSRNDYKTSKQYGRKEHRITNDILKYGLIDYIENHMEKGDSLFNYNHQETTKRLSYITNKYLGTPLSVNAIAKITIEHNLKKVNDKEGDAMTKVNKMKAYLEEVSDIRGTSLQVLFDSYIN
jgi:hypothetical protein